MMIATMSCNFTVALANAMFSSQCVANPHINDLDVMRFGASNVLFLQAEISLSGLFRDLGRADPLAPQIGRTPEVQ